MITRKWLWAAVLFCVTPCALPALDLGPGEILVFVGPNETVTRDFPDRSADNIGKLDLFVKPKQPGPLFVPGSAEMNEDARVVGFKEEADIADLARFTRPKRAGAVPPKLYMPVFTGVFQTDPGGGGTPPIWTVKTTLVACKVKIITSRPFELVQAEADKFEFNVTAVVEPADKTLLWRVEGPGADFVLLDFNESAGTSTVKIFRKIPTPEKWKEDTTVTLIAFVKDTPECSDSREVKLIKFKREDGRTRRMVMERGANPVLITLLKNRTAIGFSFDGNESGGDWVNAESAAKLDEVGTKQDPKSASSTLTLYYQSRRDRGNGTFRVRDEIEFFGFLLLLGTPKQTGIFNLDNADVGMAAAVRAKVDNDSVDLQDPEIGFYRNGFPPILSVTFGQGNAVSVSLVLASGRSWLDSREPAGFYLFQKDGSHNATQQLEEKAKVSVNSGVNLEQRNDDDWELSGKARLNGRPPFSFQVRFNPND